MESALPEKMRDEEIKQHVREYYRKLFQNNHFHSHHLPIKTGKALAEFLGYPVSLLPSIPGDYWQKFLPCGNPFPLLHLRSRDRLLNLGCGAAIDSFLVQAKHGSSVEVVNLDIVFDILRQGSSFNLPTDFHADTLSWVCGDGESLPLGKELFDWVLVNGVLNLFSRKIDVIREIWRVLKPSGFLIGADLCAGSSVPESFRLEKDAWAWCMGGARNEQELTGLLNSSGFERIIVISEEDEDLFYRVIFSCQKQ